MAEAECLNDDCDRNDTWTLRKPVDEYESGGPKCPDCGTTRVRIYDGASDSGGDRELARREEGEQRPARPQGEKTPGEQLADFGIALLDSDLPPERRREVVQEGGGLFADMANRVMDYRDAKEQAKTERAQQAGLEPAEAALACQTEDCEYVFDRDELQQDQVSCPDCGKTWDVVVEEPA